MGNINKSIFITIVFIQIITISNAQESKKLLHSERSMLLKTTEISDKTSAKVIVDKKEYYWFDSKKNAIEFFVKMKIKHDLIVVYIDSKLPIKENNLITIRDEMELIESTY